MTLTPSRTTIDQKFKLYDFYHLAIGRKNKITQGGNMKKNGIIINKETVTYYKNGKIHREDGPAIEWRNGNKHWCLNGCLHRTDGPAIELVETEQRCTINKWSINGYFHREDGPAVEWGNGYKEWWYYGKKLTEETFEDWKRNWKS